MKQTEIGLIPDDWEVKTLGEIGEPCMCKRILKEQTSPTGDIPFYKIGTFGGIPDAFISRDLFEQYKEQYNYPRKGTLLLSAAGTIGRVVVFNGKESYFQDSNIVWIDNDETKVTNDFLFYCYSRMQWKTEEGGIVSRLYNANLKSTSFIAPKSLVEQHRIAKALSDVDATISTIEKLIQKKKNIKQGAMQNLLTGKKRLPGFAKSNKTKITELGEIPEDWEVKNLGGYTTLITKGTTPTSIGDNFSDSGIKFIKIESLTSNFKIDLSKIAYISELTHKKLYRSELKQNDLLISIAGALGKTAIVESNVLPANTNQALAIIRLADNSSLNVHFLSYWINSRIIQSMIKDMSVTGAQPNISLKNVNDLPIIIPSKEEQTAIANVLSSMDKEIETLNTKLEKYRNIKTAMMQQLLTGKIRLLASETAEAISDKKQRAPNPFFKRSVLAAEIVDRLHDEPTFGHVKLQKLIFLTEKMCGIDIDSSYHRDAAGPYDNYGLRSIDSQLEKQKWFSVEHTENAYHYIPLENQGGHRQYFERYFADKQDTFDLIIKTFKTAKTEQCEIVATLYSAWEDFLKKGFTPTDDQIITEVLTNWHESKTRIEKNRWISALNWMKENGFVPQV